MALLLFSLARVSGEEVLIYKGDTFSAEGSFGSMRSFQEVYYAQSEVIEKIPEINLRETQPPMTIKQAAKAIRKKFDGDRIVVLETKLVNLGWEAGERTRNILEGKFFYLIKIFRPGEIASYVVLFDGTVIKPREKEIKPREKEIEKPEPKKDTEAVAPEK